MCARSGDSVIKAIPAGSLTTDRIGVGLAWGRRFRLPTDSFDSLLHHGASFAERFLQRFLRPAAAHEQLLPRARTESNRFPSVLRRHRHPHAHFALEIGRAS